MSKTEETEKIQYDHKTFYLIENGHVTSPLGFAAGGLHCGIKRKRFDLGWLYSIVPAAAAGVYTLNSFQAAPLIVTKEGLAVDQLLQGIIVNSGNANACTGEQGMQNAYQMRQHFAQAMNFELHHTAVASTGIIGVQLPMDKIINGIEQINSEDNTPNGDGFMQAILTTDTCIKQIAVKVMIDGQTVTIGGSAKGSGMIHPNMATMLGFITTDANIDSAQLDQLLKSTTNKTFNMITVDGDTSTNDMVLVMANGLAGNNSLTPTHPDWQVFQLAFEYVCQELAKKIARDGEGATKLIEINVEGALSHHSAQAIAKSIIGSNLVKTAIYGADPNWGRIVAAIGYSGQPVIPELVDVSLGSIKVVERGLPLAFDELLAKDYLSQEHIHIYVQLNQGSGEAKCWGCDLTYDYVKINASYRT